MRLAFLLCLFGLSTLTGTAQLLQVKLGDGDGYLGVRSKQISNEKAQRLGLDYAEGAFLTSVLPDSPAEAAGLRVFDYVVQVDDRRVSDRLSLKEIMRAYDDDDRPTVYYLRDGEARQTEVRLSDDRWSDATAIFVKEPVYVGLRRADGYQRNGVGVRVQRNSPAQEAGLRSGDVIQRVGDYRVADFEDVQLAFKQYAPGEAVAVEYLRNGAPRTDVVYPGDVEERFVRLGERLENVFDRDVVIIDRTENYGNWNGGNWAKGNWKGDCGNGAYLGVSSRTPSADKARKLGFDNRYGRYVSKVVADSPAERAGLRPFDYLTGMNGKAFSEDYCFSCALREAEPGETVTIDLIRNGQPLTVRATLGNSTDFRDSDPDDNCDRPFLGVQKVHWTAPADEIGVQVRVIDNTTAAAMQLESQSIVRRINGLPIVDWHDLSAAVRATPVGEPVRLDLTTPDGRTVKLSAPMQSYRSYKGGDCEEQHSEWHHYNWNKFDSRNRDRSDEETAAPRVDVADMRIKVEAMPADEARARDMPTDNSLTVTDLSLSPNPSMGLFDVRFDLPERGDVLIRIFNSAGREIYNYELTDFQGAFADEVDISQNGPGLYFLVVNQNGKTLTRKLVLQQR